ncbi:uncharacterized protein LOC101831837 isoform X2 [Mesocricetus auratus]|uniref:Uncharacterized protein LOC101831837 isoform X2 n=1 Tax=Mesocricetus auratus TaxID=10036 RepID=A0ABM2W7H8_MESAU|nr:uncharacterized protein LOC101831837 isoform X2 [Mesocricetus auratus]
MQLSPLSQDCWRHGHHRACPTPIERESPLTLQEFTVSHPYYILSPGNKRSYLLDNSSSSSQQDSIPGVQKQQQLKDVLLKLEEEEITPTDVKYRLQPLEAVFQKERLSGHSQYIKPGWSLVSKPHREWFKAWKMEDGTYQGQKPSHLGHIQGKRTAPRGHLNHVEFVSQDQNNAQGLVWRQVLPPDLDKNSQGIFQSTQRVSREMVPGGPMTRAHQELSQTRQGIAIVGTKSTAKYEEATASRVSHLPPLKLLPRRVKTKWPPYTPGIFQAKFQTELTNKYFFQDWRVQPQAHYGSNEKPLVSLKDQVNTRLPYMPLFTKRVKLYMPKTNGVRQETKALSTEQGKISQLSQVSSRFLASKREHVEKETA